MKALPGILLSLLIISILLYIAMYFSTNASDIKEITTGVSPSLLITEKEEKEEENNEVIISEIVDRNISFFIDKNRNRIKDNDDINCMYCKDIDMFLGKMNTNISIKVKTDSHSKLYPEIVGDNNLIWGVINDKFGLIPNHPIILGDNSSDILIPIWEYSGLVAGINADIKNIDMDNNKVRITIDKLIPIMKTAYESQKQIWIKYNDSNSNYYLILGSINTNDNKYEYSFSINNINSISIEDIEFIVF